MKISLQQTPSVKISLMQAALQSFVSELLPLILPTHQSRAAWMTCW